MQFCHTELPDCGLRTGFVYPGLENTDRELRQGHGETMGRPEWKPTYKYPYKVP